MREQGMSTAYGARNAGLAAVAGMLLLVGGCGDSSSPIQGCAGTEVMVPDCRFFNPEDLAVTPRGERLLVSQMGRMDGSLGGDILFLVPMWKTIAAGEIRPAHHRIWRCSPRTGWIWWRGRMAATCCWW
jgi:hypothetical protein